MEAKQIEKRLEWLDENRRKDADAISRILERLESIEQNVEKEVQHGQELAGELTRIAALATRIHQIDEILVNHRKEVSRQLKDAEERRTKKEKALDQLRASDLKENANTIDDLRTKIELLEKFRHEVSERKHEEVRITREMDNLRKALDDFVASDDHRARSLASMEEGRKQDAKRVADAQMEASNLRQKTDQLHGEIDTLVDRVRRAEVSISELKASEDEAQQGQKIWAEQQNVKQAEFERIWKDRGNQFDEYIKRGGEIDERMLSFEVTYQNLKQVKEDLDKALERLERRINEVTEMHRINSDRAKQDWNTLQADDQKRWNTYKLTADEQWREHNRLHDKMAAQLELLDENSSDALRILNSIQESDHERLTTMMQLFRQWATDSKE